MNLEQLFPDLLKLIDNPLPQSQFATLPYFSRYVSLLGQKQCRQKAAKIHKHFRLAKIKRGTVIYGCDETAENGYILLNGCVQILKKKSTKQRTETFPGHVCHSPQQKQNYLYQKFKIPRHKAQVLTNLFYEQKIEFKYLIFHTFVNNQQFGFGQMLRNTSRTHTAVAIEDSELLIINKTAFDSSLRDFHERKEKSLILAILSECRQEVIQQMMPKMLQIMNISTLIKYDSEDVIYHENDFPSQLYFVIDGEVEVRKKQLLKIPKKYMKHQIKDPIEKQMIIKVNKIGKGSFFGEQEIFSSRKSRNYTIVTTLNNTLILKIDHSSFLKSITDFTGYEKMLIQNSVFKKYSADEHYEKQHKKVFNAFIHQYEMYDSKKKQDLISGMMNQNNGEVRLFEAYAPEGVFFRDTFQKLQGFDQQQRSPNKKTSIRRFKQTINTEGNSKKQINKNEKMLQKNNRNEITQKILFSPKRTMNIAEVYIEELNSPAHAQAQASLNTSIASPQMMERKSMAHLQIKMHKQVGKFEEIKKDEAIYKRVLIKNGLYPVDKKIDKSKSVKALVHYNFDEVVKQCVARKNQVIRRSSKERQDEIVVDTYNRTVQSLKSRSFASSAQKFSRFSTPCKGTEQLKKRMQSIHNLGSARLTDTSKMNKKSFVTKIEDCIGVNEKPKSSQVSYRNINAHRTALFSSVTRTPERVILLNHMMKPIVYFKSNEL